MAIRGVEPDAGERVGRKFGGFSKMTKANRLHVAIVAAALCLGASAVSPKYMFVFIGDGMSVPQRMTAEEFARKTGHGPLVMNALPYQATTRTCSTTSLITDSAAAATAIACGSKTYNGAVGVDADKKRLVSVAELAKKAGRKVGIVTTTTISHATPAGFYAHRESRSKGYQIGLDLIASGVDYFAGGGFGGAENDTNDVNYVGNIYDLAAKAGYTVISNRVAFNALKPGCGKAIVRAVSGKCPFAIDIMNMAASEKGATISLAEMTAKGVELLDGPDGFFMMVEGGIIDHSGHANDAATNLREVLMLDSAVKVAVDFMDRHPDETLIVVTGDHETGGMAMGFASTGYSMHVEWLAFQKCSIAAFISKLAGDAKAAAANGRKLDFDDYAKPLLADQFGLHFRVTGDEVEANDDAAGGKFAKAGEGATGDPMLVSAADEKLLRDAFAGTADGAKKFGSAVRQLMSRKAGIGWSSGAHTALPVLSTSKGVGAEKLIGFIDNSDLGCKMKALFE